MQSLTESRMIDLWLLRKGFEPLRSDCRVSRSDAADLRSLARDECRIWYSNLLRRADPELFCPVDISRDPDLSISADVPGGMRVKLPARVVRPVAVKLYSWYAPARIVAAGTAEARAQADAYTCGGIIQPVAVWSPTLRHLDLYSISYSQQSSDELEYLLCAVQEYDDEEGDPIYTFAPEALELL